MLVGHSDLEQQLLEPLTTSKPFAISLLIGWVCIEYLQGSILWAYTCV